MSDKWSYCLKASCHHQHFQVFIKNPKIFPKFPFMMKRINNGLELLILCWVTNPWEPSVPLVTSQRDNLKGSKRCRFDDKLRFKVRKTLAGLDLHIAEPLLPCSWRIWWCARRAQSRSPALWVQTGHTPPCSGQRTSPSDGPASTVASRPGQDRRARTCAHTKQAAWDTYWLVSLGMDSWTSLTVAWLK